MSVDHRDWLGMGRSCHVLPPLTSTGVAAGLHAVRTVLPRRVTAEYWIRYRLHLADVPAPAADVRLTEVTDDVVATLRTHPDHTANQLRSGLRFWDQGFRRAYVWIAGDEPLCIQWLLTREDAPLLRGLGEWAGMYPRLPADCAQVENLHTFSGARRKGVATQFEFALCALARDAGYDDLVTHIYADNAAARGWAERMGWQSYGMITRYGLDLPGLRRYGVFLVGNGATPGATASPLNGSQGPLTAGNRSETPH